MTPPRSVPDEVRSVVFDPQAVDTHADFAALLTEARLNAGLSIRDVGRRTSIPVSTLGGYFGGRHLPSPNRPEILRELLAAMAVPPEDHDRWERALRRAFQGRRSGVRSASPYPGLRPYGPDDAETFFGRQQAKDELLRVFHRSHRESDLPIVVLTGTSGTGKSSLLRAGLVPSLVDWDIAVIDAGADPIAQLTLLAPEDPERAACLIVDQAEGLWSKADERARIEFLARISSWVRPSAPVRDSLRRLGDGSGDGVGAGVGSGSTVARSGAPPRVAVFGIRADFYSQAAEHPSLRTALQENHYILAPMTSAELAEVVVEPARLAGVTVRPDLVSAIVHEALSSRDEVSSFLPHVAHCLSRMWAQRAGSELTLELYEEIGGIGAVMRESAESTWQSLDEAERPVARRLLLAMVQTYPGLPRTSRSVLLDELSETELAIIDAFTEARVVSVVEDSASLAHEAIITAWPRLREWLEEDLERLTLVRRLERDADAWVAAHREDDLLLRGSRLLAYEDLPDEHTDLMGTDEAAFLAASRDLARREEDARARRQRQQKSLLVLVSALAIAAIIAVLGYVNANRQLGEERDAAASRQLAALSTEAGESDYVAASGLALAALRTADTLEARSGVLATSALGEVVRLTGPVGQRMVNASPDGRLLAASDSTGEIVLYDAAADLIEEVSRTAAHRGEGDNTVFALAFSPDGRSLAVGGITGVVRVLDLTDPQAPAPMADLDAGGTVYALTWGDDDTLYAGTQNPGLQHWRRSGETFEPAQAPALDQAVFALAADGERLVAGDDGGRLTMWSLEGGVGRDDVSIDVSESALVSVLLRDDEVVVGGRDRSVQRVPIEATGFGTPVEATRFDSWVNALVADTSAGYLAAASSDSSVRIWRSEDDPTGRLLTFPGPVTSMQPLGERRLAVALTNGDIHIVDLTRLMLYPGPGNVFTARFSASGDRLLIVPGAVNRFSVYDTSVPGEHALWASVDGDPESGFHGVGAISPDGRTVVSARRDGQVLGYDISDPDRPRRLFAEPVAAAMPEHMVFAPSGTFFIVGGDDNEVHVVTLDGSDVTDVTTLSGPTNYILGVAVSPDERQIAAASLDGSVHRWVRDGDGWAAAEPLEAGSALLTVAFLPDGARIVASGTEPVVRMWNVSTEQPVLEAELTGPTNEIYQLAVSPDGRIAAGSVDQTVTLWEPDTDADGGEAYRRYAEMHPGTGTLYTVDWSPDGAHLVAGSVDGAVHLWDTDPVAVRDRICASGGDLLREEEWERLVGGLEYESPCSP